jgi:hypothetical protein
MIYQYVKRYLKQNLVQPKVDCEWSQLDNLKLLNYIEQRYTLAELGREISEVKEAFKDFFEPVGSIVFRYTDGVGVKFKVFPYRQEPKDSSHLKNIIKIIFLNRKAIEYNYQGQSNQIAISGKIRREINKEVADTKESINIRELIKYSIRKALGLNDRDVIVQLKRKFIVKVFDSTKIVKAEEEISELTIVDEKKDKFNGYTAKQIEETYNEI